VMPRGKPEGVVVTGKQVRYCLRYLQDGTALCRSPLATLPIVERLAAERYRGSYWGRSSALRDIVLEVCRGLENGMEGDKQTRRLVAFLTLYTHETSISEVARQLAIHRSTVYRFVLPDACELLADALSRVSAQQQATKRA
jgi:hypothetical protein